MDPDMRNVLHTKRLKTMLLNMYKSKIDEDGSDEIS